MKSTFGLGSVLCSMMTAWTETQKRTKEAKMHGEKEASIQDEILEMTEALEMMWRNCRGAPNIAVERQKDAMHAFLGTSSSTLMHLFKWITGWRACLGELTNVDWMTSFTTIAHFEKGGHLKVLVVNFRKESLYSCFASFNNQELLRHWFHSRLLETFIRVRGQIAFRVNNKNIRLNCVRCNYNLHILTNVWSSQEKSIQIWLFPHEDRHLRVVSSNMHTNGIVECLPIF